MSDKRKITFTSEYKKSFKLSKKQGRNLEELQHVISLLANDIKLPAKYRDHSLVGNEKKYRECHVENDWLLKYYKGKDELILVLVKLGTHSELF